MIALARSRRLAPLVFGLTLLASLPSMEWCSYTWAECQARCDAADVARCGEGGRCEAAEASRVGRGDAAEPGACGMDPTGSCDRGADPMPPGERAFCIHPTPDGVTVRGADLPDPLATPLVAEIVAPEPPTPPPATHAARVEPGTRSPVLIAPHAPPQSRAPPSI